MEMEKLKWTIVEYPITDFAPIGKVITQRDILEKYKTEHPDQEIKALTGFKCDQQDKTVSLRIGITDSTIAADSGTAAKIEGVGAGENPCLCGACADNIKLQRESDTVVKLYEDVRKENDRLILRLAEIDEDSTDLAEAKEVLANSDSVPLPEVGSDTNTFDAAMRKGCDQADCIGPDEGELDDGTPDCRSDGTVPESGE